MKKVLLISICLLTGQAFAGKMVFSKNIPLKFTAKPTNGMFKLMTGLVVYTQTITDTSMQSDIVITPQNMPEVSFSALIKQSESDESILEVYDTADGKRIGSGKIIDDDAESFGLMEINARLEESNTSLDISARVIERDKVALQMKFDLKSDTGDLYFDDVLDLSGME